MIRPYAGNAGDGRPRSGPASGTGRRTRWLVVGVLAAAVGTMVLAVDPRRFAEAMERFDLRLIPVVAGLSVGCLLLQGLRWHQLLRGVGIGLRPADSLLLNTAGQAATAILPLGDLARAALASQAAQAGFGAVAATVTVQELAYTLALVLSAAPVLIATRHGIWIVLGVLMGMLVVLAILAVRRLFCLVRWLVARTPLLRHLLGRIEGLHEETAVLLRRPDTLGWSVLDAARAAVAITLLWSIVESLHPGALGWWQAAFVLALSYVGGAVSLIPGGAGVSEASTVGLLLLFDLDPPTAAAAVLVQRLFTTGASTLLGWSAYLLARRRFGFGSIWALPAPPAPRAEKAA
ncbi:MAG TPA: lysylphosphatidylglycerol synthase transmembrane domain-containing protein [Candidatus Dormibacteraeota bacterium]|nr:lysylphosphatidylglycerol synthase transmembrane domain-containing protein [Candidatus Dormibacteraeota bacterium]